MIHYKYIALGLLVGYLVPYVLEIINNKKETVVGTLYSYDSDNEEGQD
jgi:hypothetical protein